MQLYPDIGLTQSHFSTGMRPHLLILLLFLVITKTIASRWALKETRRSAFLQFAKNHSFDPLVPANWYQLSGVEFNADHVSIFLPSPTSPTPLPPLYLLMNIFIVDALNAHVLLQQELHCSTSGPVSRARSQALQLRYCQYGKNKSKKEWEKENMLAAK